MHNKNAATSSEDSKLAGIIGRIPNGGHLYRIRDALGSGHAAVMVGSGFSLNAQNGNRLTLWDGLIESLLGDLYGSDAEKAAAKRRLGGTSGMLRLAEEYAAVLTRAQLDKRLHELLPDAGVTMPGDLHVKLLSLNWADVYTTNYDTLLERALDSDRREFNPRIKRRYQIVVSPEEMPFSKSNGRPRIVKLHGSLRTGSRLIVTEEDYRSYPSSFAPFVNTVQQSILENVFCLLGFSGDDPNFLAWTGWVRDRLGDKTPPIYLITLRPVQEGQRLTLERRNVFPIDISRLGELEGKSGAAESLKVLLNFWSDGSAARRADWPYHRPMDELKAGSPTIEQLFKWTECAQQNRKRHPGWLATPADNRIGLTRGAGIAHAWHAYRDHKDKLPLWFKMVFLSEVTWICDEALTPVGLHFVEEMENVFQEHSAETTERILASMPEGVCDLRPSADELENIRARLWLSMLQCARENSDSEKFDHWNGVIHSSQVFRKAPEVRRLALHEEILQKLEQGQRREAFQILEKLASIEGNGDLYWSVRIGALYGELGWVERGSELVRSGLHAIREAIQFEGESAKLVSREQWAERLLDALSFSVGNHSVRRKDKNGERGRPKPPEVTLREAVPREEDATQATSSDDDDIYRDIDARASIEHPNTQIDILLREIKFVESLFEQAKVEFDDRYVSDKKGVSHVRSEATSAAISFCRLAERVALVPALGEVGFFGRDFAACFRILSTTQGAEESMRILLRVLNESATESLGMASVDQLSYDVARSIFLRSIADIEWVMSGVDIKWNYAAVRSLRLALDLASRVAFRLNAEDVTAMMDIAIRLYKLPQVQNEFQLHHVFAQFMERAVRLLSRDELAKRSSELMGLNPSDSVFLQRSVWPNVVEFLTNEDVSPNAGTHWHAVTNTVFDEAGAASSDDGAANYHFARLDWLYRNGLMTPEQVSRFSSMIWHGVEREALPDIPGFYRGVVLVWPAPDKMKVERVFRDWIGTESIEAITGINVVDGKERRSIGGVRESFLANVLLTGNKGVSFEWPRNDLLIIVDNLEKWWRDEGPYLLEASKKEVHGNFARGILTGRLRLMAHVMHRIIARHLPSSDSERQRISDWLSELWEGGLQLDAPLVPLLFAALSWWPERSATVIDMTVSILCLHTDHNITNAALNAAGHWLLSEDQETDSSRRYVTYLVESVRSLRTPHLDLRLTNISELLRLGAKPHFDVYCESLMNSLSLMLQDLQRDVPDRDTIDFASRPLLRVAVVSALLAIGEHFPRVKRLAAWEWAMQTVAADKLLIVRKLVG